MVINQCNRFTFGNSIFLRNNSLYQTCHYNRNTGLQQGYMERVSDPSDGRATLVRLSERGWSVHQVARAAVQGVQEEWTQVVGTAEMGVFLATLARLADQSAEAETTDQSTGQRTGRWRGRRTIGR